MCARSAPSSYIYTHSISLSHTHTRVCAQCAFELRHRQASGKNEDIEVEEEALKLVEHREEQTQTASHPLTPQPMAAAVAVAAAAAVGGDRKEAQSVGGTQNVQSLTAQHVRSDTRTAASELGGDHKEMQSVGGNQVIGEEEMQCGQERACWGLHVASPMLLDQDVKLGVADEDGSEDDATVHMSAEAPADASSVGLEISSPSCVHHAAGDAQANAYACCNAVPGDQDPVEAGTQNQGMKRGMLLEECCGMGAGEERRATTGQGCADNANDWRYCSLTPPSHSKGKRGQTLSCTYLKSGQKHALGTKVRMQLDLGVWHLGAIVKFDARSKKYSVEFQDGEWQETKIPDKRVRVVRDNDNASASAEASGNSQANVERKEYAQRLDSKMKRVKEPYREEVLKKRVKVYFPYEKTWFRGVIDKYDPRTGEHHVAYDDGDDAWYDVRKEKDNRYTHTHTRIHTHTHVYVYMFKKCGVKC